MAKAVLIVDDNALIRQALCEMFNREADFEVCGEAENGAPVEHYKYEERRERIRQLFAELYGMRKVA